MQEEELNAIEAIAKAATPGPWPRWRGRHHNQVEVVDLTKDEDLDHIAWMDPTTTLRLVAEARRGHLLNEVWVIVAHDREGKPRGPEKIRYQKFYATREEAQEAFVTFREVSPEVASSFGVHAMHVEIQS